MSHNNSHFFRPGIALAALLHLALGLMLMHLQRSKPVLLVPNNRITLFELQPTPDSPAVAQRPAPAPQKPRPAQVTPRRVARKPVDRPVENLIGTLPTPAPPQPTVAAPPAPTPASAAPKLASSAGHVARIPFEYLLDVSTTIDTYRIYPLSARDAHQQGTPVIHIHLRRNGTLLDAHLLKSSGYPALDVAALGEVYRISKFPPLPDDFSAELTDFAIDQPVSFHLR